MLYTMSSSPYTCDFVALLRTTAKNDNIVLLSDGVIAGLNGSLPLTLLTTSQLKLYALKNDIIARGLYKHISPDINIISYNEFVILTEKNIVQLSWT